MATFPSDSMARVSAMVHRYDRTEGAFTLEAIIGGVTSDFGLPAWSSMPASAEPIYKKISEGAARFQEIMSTAVSEGRTKLTQFTGAEIRELLDLTGQIGGWGPEWWGDLKL